MLLLLLACFICGSWVSLVSPMVPSESLLIYILALACYGSLFVVLKRWHQWIFFSLLSGLLGCLISLHSIAVWQVQKEKILPNKQSVFRCGRIVVPLSHRLPSQRYVFRLDSYRWYSFKHRNDQLVLHVYQDVLLKESEHMCVMLHRSRPSQLFLIQNQHLSEISHGIVGHAQMEKVIFSYAMAPSIALKVRAFIRHWVEQFSSEQVQHVLLALFLGDRSGLTRDDWSLFSSTGTSHLIAISGLHVMWIVLGIVALLSRLVDCFSVVYRYVPRSVVLSVLEIILACSYGCVIYPSTPAYRALMLLVMHAFIHMFGGKTSSFRALLLVLTFSCVTQPFFYLQASACLSYWASYWLLHCPRLGRDESCRSWLFMQTWMLLGLAPLTLFYFGHWYAISWFANAWVVPWVGLLIFPVCLLSLLLFLVLPGVFHWCMPVFQLSVSSMLHCLHFLSKHPLFSVSTIMFGFFSVAITLLLFFLIRHGKLYAYAGGLLFPLLLIPFCGMTHPYWKEEGEWLAHKKGGVLLIRRGLFRFLYAGKLSPTVYRYALPFYALKKHWLKADICVSSDVKAVFPKELCRFVLHASLRRRVLYHSDLLELLVVPGKKEITCSVKGQSVAVLSSDKNGFSSLRLGMCQMNKQGKRGVDWQGFRLLTSSSFHWFS